MKWFKHQADARNSLKLRKVRRKYGADGYAIYWFCLEAIAYEVDKDNLTFDLKEDAETIAFELSIQEKRVQEIMIYMVEAGLFESSQGVITCLKLAESIDKSMTNSPKMRAWLESKSVMPLSDDVMTLPDTVNTCAELEVEVEKNIKRTVHQDEREQLESDSFEHWWKAWHKKQGKKKAFAAWKKTIKKMDTETIRGLTNHIVEDVKFRIADLETGGDKFFGFDGMLAATYLNGESYNDDI